MTNFARGDRADGICDRCGLTFLLKELSFQYVNRTKTDSLVCESCLDQDHPQYDVGKYPIFDPQALQNPRPDTGKTASTSLFGWNPLLGQWARLSLGNLRVVIS